MKQESATVGLTAPFPLQCIYHKACLFVNTPSSARLTSNSADTGLRSNTYFEPYFQKPLLALD